MYRFRPMSRLINEDGVSGELDSLYIYFADRESLNDPLEGYKNIFFSGDKIIWRNLLKHYTRCLTNDCYLYLTSTNGNTLKSEIDIFASKTDSHSSKNELNNRIMHRLDSEPGLAQYIELLGNNRKISRPELIGHLNLVHTVVLSAILNTLQEHNTSKEPTSFFSERAAEHMNKIRLLVRNVLEAEPSSRSLQDIMESSYLLTLELQLRNRHYANISAEKEHWAYLLFEYPESYCMSLDKLIYPDWYVACFMESCTDSSIWGTYGGNHQDVCLIFRVEEFDGRPSIKLNCPAGLRDEEIVYEKMNIPLEKVTYDQDFIDVDFFRSLGQLSMPKINEWYFSEDGDPSICAEDMQLDIDAWRNKYWDNYRNSSKIKLKAWDREQEWRVTFHSNIHDLSNRELRKFKFEFDSLEGIIFGINTTMNDKLKLIKKIESLCSLHKRAKFNFYQATYNATTKDIKHFLLSHIQVGHQD